MVPPGSLRSSAACRRTRVSCGLLVHHGVIEAGGVHLTQSLLEMPNLGFRPQPSEPEHHFIKISR